MALSPQEQGLTQEEISHADRIEKEIDKALVTMPAAEKITLKPTTHFVSQNSQTRVQFEIAGRYRAVGWQVEWDFGGRIVLSRKRP